MTRSRTTGQTLVYVAGLSLTLGATTLSGGLAKGPTTPTSGLAKPAPAKATAPVSAAQIQKLEQAVKLAPASADAHFKLAQAYCQSKKFEQARNELRRAIRLGR